MKRRLAAALFLLMLFSLLVYGKARPFQNNTSLQKTKGPVELVKTLTIEDNGCSVELSSGGVFKVELKIQGGTGYSWYIDDLDETHLKLLDKGTKEIAPRGIVGGPVLGVWSFEAVAPGDTVLHMLYYRIWEGKGRAVKKFELKLHIK